MRTETEIFKELKTLCAKSGYVHVLAYLRSRDNFIPISKEITSYDFYRLRKRTQQSDRLLQIERLDTKKNTPIR